MSEDEPVRLPFGGGINPALDRTPPPEPSAPHYHWGAIKSAFTLGEVLGIAARAMRDEGLDIHFDPGRDERTPVLIGSTSQVLVFIGCGSVDHGDSWVMVAAASSDSGTAEGFRNRIRERIAKTIAFDHPEDGLIAEE
jgi:hypothetical protein